MSRFCSSSLLYPVLRNSSSDRLLDDCALDHTLGVLRRSIPRTYAGRFENSVSPRSTGLFRRGGSTAIAWMKRVISSNAFDACKDVGGMARHAALASGFVAAVIAIFVSILQQNGATALVATGFISFATVAIVTLLLVLPALNLLVWLGVDFAEFAGQEKE